MEQFEVDKMVDDLVWELKAGKEPDLSALDDSTKKALLARIEDKKRQLAGLRKNWSKSSLTGEYISVYKKEIDALLGLSMRLDRGIAERIADMLASCLRGPSPEGLSPAQKRLLDILKIAGTDGIKWNSFLGLADLFGVDPDSFGDLVERKLLATKAGVYIHPDFV